MSDNWHRIEKVVKWTGLSVNAFSRAIGLNRSENLYQIKRGNNGISRDLAETICAKYPSISKVWLLLGEGEMFVEDNPGCRSWGGPDPGRSGAPLGLSPERTGVPFYRIDVSTLVRLEQWPESEDYISASMFDGADFAAISTSGGMEPEIPRGAVVVCRTEPGAIVPGESYLVVSPRFTGIRIVRKEPDSSKLRLVPRNTAHFDELLVEQDEIEEIHAVRGVIITKS